MDAEQMFIQFEERALSGELIRTSNGGNHVLAYFNNAEKINNGRCKRWIVHFIKNDELVASCDYTEGIQPKFKSWDVFDKENKIIEHKFVWGKNQEK